MAGEVALEISLANGKIKDQCVVETSPCLDLSNGASADCNGVNSEAVPEVTENGNGNEDADRTYVFVNGSDAVAETCDNDEKFIKKAIVEECGENFGELKVNGETGEGGAKINGCNGHCDVGDVAPAGDEAVEVENGEDTTLENEDQGNLPVPEGSRGESEELGLIEEVNGLNSVKKKALDVVNCEEKFEVESSFEVIERIPESHENHEDAKGSDDCEEPSDNTQELSEQVGSTSEIVKEVPGSQAVNEVRTVGSDDLKEPVNYAAEKPQEVQCTHEVDEVVPEPHGDADDLDDTTESPKIINELPLQAEFASEVEEEVPSSHPLSHVDADCSFDSKEFSEHAVDRPVQVESSSDDAEENPESQAVTRGDEEVTDECKELSECIMENTAELSEQAGENQKSGVILTDTAAPELAVGGSEEEQASDESKPCSIEEKVELSQSTADADVLDGQDPPKTQEDDANSDVKQEESVEIVAESSTVDEPRNIDGDHDQTDKPAASLESSDIDNIISESTIENDQCLVTAPVTDPVPVAIVDGDSIVVNLDMKECDADAGNAEALASPADCTNVPGESAECLPTPEETVAMQDLHVDERSFAVANGISSPQLDDGEPAQEHAIVDGATEPVFEVEVGKAEATASSDAEVGSGAHDGSAVQDNISANRTNLTDSIICFGSISHEELSSLTTEGRSSEAKSTPDATFIRLSPDLESNENDGNDKSSSQGTEVVDDVPQTNEVAPVEGSRGVVIEAPPMVPEVERRFFNYLVRFPRCDEEDLNEKIKAAQANVDNKTRSRDAIKAEIQMSKATRDGFFVEVNAASAEEQSARDSLKSKWQEIETLQSVVNKVKNAMSIDDIDKRIQRMDHSLVHETLPLKEEKQLLREIKQLKQLRKQLLSNTGTDNELREAIEQKDQTEDRLKVLRKEAEILKGNLSKAEGVRKAVRKKNDDGKSKLQELEAQFRAADDVRQEAYQHLKSLKVQLREKNKYFYKYKDDAAISNDLGFKRDREGVSDLCIRQVEDFMELWNNNVEFRSDYIKWSVRGTLRRLGTKDGRSLGVNEQPPAIPSHPSDRVVKKGKSTVEFPSLEQAKARAAPVNAVSSANNVHIEPTEQKRQNSKAKAPAKSSEEVVPASVSVRDVEIAEVIEEPKLSKEEEERSRREKERARREEELKKEEEAARLKEQRRLEEKAKAEAALERKKRILEKAQARAAAKAQKEAEQKEKEREKKLKKKERKKAAVSVPSDATTEREPAPSSQAPAETPQELETREKVQTAAKRPQKSTHFTKQIKVKQATIPPPLRNRGKRKMQTWMWALLIAAVILALFLAGNGRQLF